MNRIKKQHRPIFFEEMEPRLLFSADGLEELVTDAVAQSATAEPEVPATTQDETEPGDATVTEPGSEDYKQSADSTENSDVQEASGQEENAAPDTAQEATTSTVAVDSAATDASVTTENTVRKELVLINDNVTDYEQLIADIQAATDDSRSLEIVILDSQESGLDQVSSILAESSNLSTIHILTHGTNNSFILGSSELTVADLQENSDELSAWNKSLTEDADILLYGCNIAARDNGEILLTTLAELTGADVAASDDPTGSAELGGDWDLEMQVGKIDTASIVSADGEPQWEGLLGSSIPTDIVFSYETDTHAASVINATFESPNVVAVYGSVVHEIADGWTLSGPGIGTYNPGLSSYPSDSYEGSQVAYIDRTYGGTISQTLTETFLSGKDYSLSVLVGNESSVTDSTGWEIRLYAGEQLLGSTDNTSSPILRGTFTDVTLSLSATSLTTYSAYYGEALRIELYNAVAADVNAHFDNVRLTVSTTLASINEYAINGTVVNSVQSVTDADAGEIFTFALLNSEGHETLVDGAFAIDSSTGKITVADSSLIDYETATSHNITVQATDSSSNTYTEVLTIAVLDSSIGSPVNNVPAAQTTAEDTSLLFNSANGNLISVTAEPDQILDVTLTISNGTLTLSGTTGLSFSDGDGDADANMTFSGTVENINAALEGLSFNPTSNYNGTATLTLNSIDATYNNVDINIDLAGYYSFDNTSDLGSDDSGNNNTATVVGATSYTDSYFGDVLSFAGGDDYLQITGMFGNPADVTLAAWVNLTAADTNGSEVISLGDNIILRVDEEGEYLRGYWYIGSEWDNLEYNVTLEGGGWHHVAFSFSDSTDTATLYLDGVAVSSVTTTDSIQYTYGPDTFIGKHGNGQVLYDYTGYIDDARIYSNALSSAEIEALSLATPVTADSVEITISAVNDAPAGTDRTVDLAEDSDYVFTLADFGITDTESDVLAAVWFTSLPAEGELKWNGSPFNVNDFVVASDIADGQLTYTPATDYNGTAGSSFTFQVQDEGGTTNGGIDLDPTPNTFTFNVTAVNDAPTLTPYSPPYTTTENSAPFPASVATLIAGNNIVDPDSTDVGIAVTGITGTDGTIEYSIDGGTTWITFAGLADTNALLLRPTDLLRLSPSTETGGTVYFAYRAWDQSDSNSAGTYVDASSTGGATAFSSVGDQATLTITNVNDAPQFTSSPIFSATEDALYIYTVFASDVDNSSLTFSATTLPGWLSLTDNNDGTATLTGTPTNDDIGANSVVITVTDGTAITSQSFSIDVTNTNDAPVAGNMIIAISEDTLFTGTLTIASDADGDVITYSLTTDATNGSVTVNGDGTFTYNPDTDFNGSDSFTYTVSDTNGGSNVYTVAVTVNSINDAPVMDNSGAPMMTTISEDDITNTGMTVAELLATGAGGAPVSDVDGDGSGIAIVTRNNGNGQWQYSTDGGTTWYQVGTVSETSALLLRDIDLIRFLPDEDNGITKTFDFRAWDQTSGTAGDKVDVSVNGTTTAFSAELETATIIVNSVNDAPVLDNSSDLTLTAQIEDAGAPVGAVGTVITDLVNLSSNVSDVDDSSQTGLAIIAAETSHGSWWYTIDGGSNWYVLGEVSETSARVLNASSLTRIYFESDQNYTGTITDAIIFRAWDRSLGASGTLQDASTTGGTSAFSTTIETADLEVTAVNDAPTASDNTLTINEDIPYTFSATDFGFSDVDGDSLDHITITSLPTAGILTIGGAAVAANDQIVAASITSLVFTPGTNGNGTSYASFNFTVNDGNTNSAIDNTITFDVTTVNDMPTASDNTFTINEDTPYTFSAADFGFSDVDGDSLDHITITSLPTAGILNLGGAAVAANDQIAAADITSLVFTPGTNGNGTSYASFNFTVNDGIGNSPANNTITFDVTAVNDAPTASDNTFTINEDTPYTFSAADFGFSDVDGDSLNHITITNPPTAGILILSGVAVSANDQITAADITNLVFTPAIDVNGASYASFDFSVNDGNTDSAIDNTITFNVTAVNDAPTASTVNLGTILEDSVLTIVQTDLLVNADDAEGDSLMATDLTLTHGNGTLLDNLDGTWNFIPQEDWNGTVSFDYQITDGTDTTPNSATLVVTPVNDAPTAIPDSLSLAEGDSRTIDLSANDIDVDDSLNLDSVTIISSPTNGSITVNGDGTVTYTHDGSETSVDSFSYTIKDQTGAVSNIAVVDITITPVNNAPIATGIDLGSIDEDSGRLITQADLLLGVTDAEGDSLAAANLTLASGQGILLDNLNGTWHFIPEANWHGTVGFTYEITDGTVTISNSGTLNVAAVNDTPLAQNDNLSGTEATVITGNILLNDRDVDGDALLPLLITNVSHGTLSLNPDGTFTYTANAGFFGTDSFTYIVNDGFADSNAATVKLTITPATTVTGEQPGDNGNPATELNTDPTTTSPDQEFLPAWPEEQVTSDGNDDDNPVTINDSGNFDDDSIDESPDGLVAPVITATPTPATEPAVILGTDSLHPEDPNETDNPEENANFLLTHTFAGHPAYLQAVYHEHIQQRARIFTDNSYADILQPTLQMPTESPITFIRGYNPEINTLSHPRDISSVLLAEGQIHTRLDTIYHDMDLAFNQSQQEHKVITYVSGGMFASFSAGALSYVLRAGSLMSSLLATMPVWKSFDPIAVLADSKQTQLQRKREKMRDNLDEADQTDSQDAERLFTRRNRE